MLLELSRVVDVGAAPPAAFAFIRDVPRLTGCVPNVADLRALDADRRYAATVSDKLGPFRLSVPIEIDVRDVEDGRRIVAGLTGADNKGQARVKGDLQATVEPHDNGSRVALGMRLEVLGRLASLGALPMRRRADELFAEFARRLQAELGAAPANSGGGPG
ncbi:MAG: hypothetical protein IT305_16895 [Chloroflexi bacterium]|nr:hypothetical protein [Chloroflexota bacterium]